jgi:hypothetical protein
MSQTPEDAARIYLRSVGRFIPNSARGANGLAIRIVLSDMNDTRLHLSLSVEPCIVPAGECNKPVLILTLRLETLRALTSGDFDYRNPSHLAKVSIEGDSCLFREIIDRVRGENAAYAKAYARAERAGSNYPVTSITKHSGLTDDLVLKSIETSRPIVIQGINVQLGPEAWTFPYLQQKYGSVIYNRYNNQPVLLGKHIESILNGECKTTGGVILPDDLRNEVRWPLDSKRIILQNAFLFLGSAGAITPLHRDAGSGMNAHIIGRKRWTLFSPDQAALLYPRHSELNAGYQHADVNLNEPDLERHPLFSSSRPLEITVYAGEILLIPSGWFHQVELLDDALSVTFPILNQ